MPVLAVHSTHGCARRALWRPLSATVSNAPCRDMLHLTAIARQWVHVRCQQFCPLALGVRELVRALSFRVGLFDKTQPTFQKRACDERVVKASPKPRRA